MAILMRVDSHEVWRALLATEYAVSEPSIIEWLNEDAAEIMQDSAERAFDSQGRSGSTGGWEPLAEATQKYRFFQGFNPVWPINVRYGDLRDFLEGSRGNIAVTGIGTQLEWPGFTDRLTEEKLKVAQQGKKASRGQRETPARPIVEITEIDAATLLNSLEGHIMMVMAGGMTY